MILQAYKGSALIYAIIVIVLISCFSLLFLTFFSINTNLLALGERNAIADLYGSQALRKIINDSTYANSQLTTPQMKVFVSKRRWGMYDICESLVLTPANDTVFHKIALVGKGRDIAGDTVLILSNISSPSLFLSNNVSIKGTSFVPGGEVRFYRNQNTEEVQLDRVFKSPVQLPEIKDVGQLVLSFNNTNKSYEYRKLVLSDSIQVSFAQSCRHISADTVILNGSLSGHIRVSCKKAIINSNARLKDVIVSAGSVFIQPGFTGVCQIFATDTIVIGTGAKMRYPSVVAALPHPDAVLGSFIAADSLLIEGEVYLYTTNAPAMRASKIQLRSGSYVTGGVYANVPVQFEGKCFGTIICKSIFGDADGSFQENFLQNATLDIYRLPDYYSYSTYFPMGGSKKIIQWLH